jgi:hypothetical protein
LAIFGCLDATFVIKSKETIEFYLSKIFIAFTIYAMLVVEQNLVLLYEGKRAELK